MAEKPPTYDMIRETHQQLHQMKMEYWLSQNLFTFQWWLLVIVFIVPWLIWWKFVDKKRISQILLFGTLLMILVMILDDFGVESHYWSYPYQLFMILPRLIAVDQGIIIVAHMFLYQYYPQWKKFIIANAIMATIFSFVMEPITVWIGIYKLENWHYAYSFPIYIAKAILIKLLVDDVFLKKERRSNQK